MASTEAAAAVSVVIPVHNAAPYIAEALASVYAQDAGPLEVIVVDDGSSDGSLAVAEAGFPAIRTIRQEQAGIGAARNRGVEAARGEYLAFLDADDRWTADRLRRLRAVFASQPRLAMAFGLVRHFLCPTLPEEARRRLHCPDGLAPGFSAASMLIRRESFLTVGAFDEGLRVGEFIDWLARARDQGLTEVLLDEVVLERRIHQANSTLQRRQFFGDYAQLLKRTLDRRRARPDP